MYIFVDETGDLGERGSTFFVMMLVATEDPKGVERAIQRTHKRVFPSKRRPPELKGFKMDIRRLRYFYRKMSSVPYQLVAVVLDKGKVNLGNANRRLVYAQMLCTGLRTLPNLSFPLYVLVDRYFSDPEFGEVVAYVKGYLAGRYGDPGPVELFQEDSRRRKEIQAADLFAWGVSQKLVYGREDWYKVFEERIEVVEFLL